MTFFINYLLLSKFEMNSSNNCTITVGDLFDYIDVHNYELDDLINGDLYLSIFEYISDDETFENNQSKLVVSRKLITSKEDISPDDGKPDPDESKTDPDIEKDDSLLPDEKIPQAGERLTIIFLISIFLFTAIIIKLKSNKYKDIH